MGGAFCRNCCLGRPQLVQRKATDLALSCPLGARTGLRVPLPLQLQSCTLSLAVRQEGLKLVLSLVLVIFEHAGLQGAWAALRAIQPGDSIRLAVPAVLFVLQNAAVHSETPCRACRKRLQWIVELGCSSRGHAARYCPPASSSFPSLVAG